jgi:cell division transport system ATP-binding protein
VRSPELIIADEPTGAQDRDFTWSLMDLFLKANITGTTVVVATHDREIVRRVRKRCGVLKDGRMMVEEGSAACFY